MTFRVDWWNNPPISRSGGENLEVARKSSFEWIEETGEHDGNGDSIVYKQGNQFVRLTEVEVDEDTGFIPGLVKYRSHYGEIIGG